MAVPIYGTDGVTSNQNQLQVTDGGAARVALPITAADAGFVLLAAENDSGSVTGTKTIRPAQVTQDGRLRVGLDTLLFEDSFCSATINPNFYKQAVVTQTIVSAGGVITLNNSSLTTTNTYSSLTTYKAFSITQSSPLTATFSINLSSVSGTIPANTVTDLGFAYFSAMATPLDGLYFKFYNAELHCVVNVGGAETESPAIDLSKFIDTSKGQTTYCNVMRDYSIIWSESQVIFKIDGLTAYIHNRAIAQPGPSISYTLPIMIRTANAGAAAAALQIKMSAWSVVQRDICIASTAGTQAARLGRGGYQGITTGQTAQWANSVAPAPATMSNTAAGYTSLGGLFKFSALAGASTDYALFGYTMPAGSTIVNGRSFYITGVDIHSWVNGAAIATASTVLMWGIGVGSTAVSLATADAIATKGPRRVPLGTQYFAIGSEVGKTADNISCDFLQSPLMAEPGTIIHIILRIPVGTATASQTFEGSVTVKGYWE